MEIKTNLLDSNGEVNSEFVYNDGNPEENLNGLPFGGVGGFCFYENKLVLVYGKGKWSTPGGAIEKGETYIEGLKREVKEESNMEVLYQECIGYQDIYNKVKNVKWRHAMLFCVVRPFGDFIADPDGDITEIKLIDPSDFSKYMEYWGEPGIYMLKKALKIKDEYYRNK